ncbi:MAG TPA: hypothetical protein DIS66_00860, partial [Candidatus Omnitrophica bacterium]|nr:hypothetical protein [Candidatus Omnitrophota bacterium]
MALKKINWVILGVVALLAVAWVFGAQRSKQTPGIKTKSDLLSASGATVLSGSPRGIAQKVETASFSLPGFQVQA